MEQQYQPLPKPYKTGIVCGIPYVKQLLRPGLKELIDLMAKFKGCYIGDTDTGAWLYIDGNPTIRVNNDFLDDLKLILARDVKTYHDIVEYRLSPERYKEILIYYL
jgi:hypothetical protein